MGWAKLDDLYPWHRKVRRLTDAAFRLHTTAIAMCARDETDGLVTLEDIGEMPSIKRPERSIEQLLAHGLWEVVDGGWEVHDFLEYNPSHEQKVRDRARAAERQRARRERQAEKGDVSRRDKTDVTA